MKKFLSILAIAALLVACGGEQKKSDDAEDKGAKTTANESGKTKSKVEQMHDLQEDMVVALENDDYEAFKAVALEVYNLGAGMTKKESQQAEESISPELKARAEKYTTRAEEWSYTVAMELIEEGKIEIPE